jgi:hypothetical protein
VKINPLTVTHKYGEENKKMQLKYQSYLYQFHYKGNEHVESLKVAHGTPVFHGTQSAYHCLRLCGHCDQS